jgi:hypothetical protein
MAKTKYIVPVVAMMLCVVSLIGEAYATYKATLTNNESTTADNKYVTLTMGQNDIEEDVVLEWNYATTYNNSSQATKTWTLVENQKQLLLTFSVAADKVNATSANYTLATSALSVASISTHVSVKV